jgi:chaperonin cofactor prefoldin
MPLEKTERLEHRIRLLESQVHRLQEELNRLSAMVENAEPDSAAD